jgi:hypothetical protein
VIPGGALRCIRRLALGKDYLKRERGVMKDKVAASIPAVQVTPDGARLAIQRGCVKKS